MIFAILGMIPASSVKSVKKPERPDDIHVRCVLNARKSLSRLVGEKIRSLEYNIERTANHVCRTHEIEMP